MIKLTAQERQLLQQANNAEGFASMAGVSDKALQPLMEKGLLLYYDGYWITYDGEDALKGVGDEPERV